MAKWSWAAWLKAVDSCSRLNEKDRVLARAFHNASKGRGRSRRWVSPWQIQGNPSYGDLHRLEATGFLRMAPGLGVHYPVLDPLPEPASIKLNPGERALLRRILGGACLWWERKPGWFAPRKHRSRWRLHRSAFDSDEVPFKPRDATSLGRKGLLYQDGVVSNYWLDPSCVRYSVRTVRLIGTTAFEKVGRKALRDRSLQTSRGA